MNTIEAIETRRAVKHFDPDYVMPDEDLGELIRLAKLAPSSFNMQNYRLLVVRDKAVREKLKAVAWNQDQITDASVVFVMCGDLKAHEDDPDKYWGHAPDAVREMLGSAIKPFYDGKAHLTRDESIRSSAFAGLTIMLAAKSMGYDSCPMVGFDEKAVAELINLPEDYALSFIVVVGKMTKPAWDRGPRLPEDEVVFYDTF